MVDVITQILNTLFLSLVMAWLLRSVSPKAKVEAGKRVLSYGRSIKVASVTVLGFFLSLILLMLMTATEDITMPLVIFCGFALLGLYMTLDAYFVRVLYDDTYIYCYSSWRKERKIAWYNIKAIKFSPITHYFICSTTFNGKIRLSLYLSGVQEFLQEAERRGIPSPSSITMGNS